MEQENREKPNVGVSSYSPFRGQGVLLLTAIMFYTRIPVSAKLKYSPELLNRSTRYFPFIGWIVGGTAALVFWAAQLVFPLMLAVLLSMIATILLTGAFHEDGFADFCDGFGGGVSREKIFTIMKDSRLGTYGAVGLVGVLSTKFLALSSLSFNTILIALLAGHAFSRLAPVFVIFTSYYSREDESSKTKPIGKKGKYSDLLIASLFGLLPLALFSWQFIVILIPLSVILVFCFQKYIERKIGGYTGDCLGALQQLVEVLFYLALIISFKTIG